MRLWSLHPRYLDTKGLVALWREGLLAKHVLEGKTKGYRHHPQLKRFQESSQPIVAINAYLKEVYAEACERGHCFTSSKIDLSAHTYPFSVTSGQMRYELDHLREKLKRRDPDRLSTLPTNPEPHPLFNVIAGGVETWEKTSPRRLRAAGS